MAAGNWRERLLESTRGRVVALLRRSAQTVSDLAEKLELTSNAVRLHLSALERDGLIEQHGTRREWTGKPAFVYRTTLAAEALFPKPYDVVLNELLAVLEERRPGQAEELLREAGGRLAEGRAASSGGVGERAAHAAAVLTELGGLAEVEEDEAGVRIRGFSCPLGEVAGRHPEACRLAESLVSRLAGVPVKEECERGERPRCAFRIVGTVAE